MKSFLNNQLVFLIVIILIVTGVGYGLKKSGESEEKNILLATTKPIAGFFSGAGYWLGNKFDFLSSIGSLKSENEQLFGENLRLKSKLAELENISRENESLRKQLDLAPREDFQLEAALVIGRDFEKNNELLYISKGRKHGIENGMPVIVDGGVLVGKVFEVFHNTAEVELVMSRDIKINAELQESEAKGIVHGEYGTSVVMDMTPQTVEINPGDSVVTSGLGGNLPRGLLIGYAKETSSTSDQLFQKTSLALPAPINKIRAVSVIKNTK